MFLISLLNFFYGFLCTFVILLVLIQRGKGNMGLGNLGGGNQVFGAAGGHSLMQQVTWVCCFLLLAGSFILATTGARFAKNSSFVSYTRSSSAPIEQEL